MLTLPEYTLTEPLHEGSATILYRGIRSADGARVAIKLLKTEYPSLREIARFKHEYMITRDLDVPGVVKAYGLSKSSAGLALVLEDFGGRALSDILRSKRLPLRAALEIAVAVAGAVAMVHDRRIIHRDIKPHNILVSAEPFAVKLTDFGIAVRLADGSRWEAGADVMEGTLAYMSPEQTGRMNRAVDQRSDLYSLGVTLYEVFTDALPFQAADQAEMVHSHIARTPLAPHARSPEIPEVVSAIVMKLLAKTAEDRYQSAHGLKADLEECLSRLDRTGHIDPFPIAQRDAPREIRIPEALYGRGAEVAAIVAAFEKAREEGARVVLVSGPAGIGKSALMAHVQREVAARGGRYVVGKSHQLRQNIPYAAIASALRELVRRILAEPAEAVARWKGELLAALGGQGQIVIDLIPELAWLLGPQPAMPALGPTEARNRFSLVFQSFVRALAGRGRPILIFLDDLQWIDPASLRLVAFLLGDPRSVPILFAGGYRDREIGQGHVIAPVLDEIRDHADRVDEIALSPLDLPRVAELVKDTVGGGEDRALSLAQVLFDKTAGNPFFIGQVLKALHADGRIAFDPEAGIFRWDLDRIRATIGAADVIERATAEVSRLPPEARRALEVAACIGQRLEVRTLAGALGVSLDQAQRDLIPSEEVGILVSALVEREEEADAGAPPSFDVVYRFTRERVQEAIYASIDGQRRQEIHLRIGRVLSADDPGGERIFDVVDHKNRGSAYIVDRGEQIDLARRNRAAAERAKAATAYQSAVAYYQAGARILGDAGWREDEDLAFAIHLGLAECEHLTGNVEAAEALFDLLLSHAHRTLDRAQVYDLMIVLLATRGDFAGVLRVSKPALALFGIELPESREDQQAAVGALLASVTTKLSERSIEDLVDVPATADPEQVACRALLAKVSAPFFVLNPLLYVLDILLQVDRCFTYGHSGLSCFAFGTASFLFAGMFGRMRESHRAFLIARAVEPRFDSVELRCKNTVALASCAHYFEPHRTVDGYFARARAAGPMSGDFIYLSYAHNLGAILKLLAGEELGVVRDDIAECLASLSRTRDVLARSIVELERQAIHNLEGRTAGRASLSDDGFDEDAFVEKSRAHGFSLTVAFYQAIKLMTLFIHGEREQALAVLPLAVEASKRFGGFHFTTHVPFFAGLLLAAEIPTASPADRQRYFDQLVEHHAKLGALAELCPENFRHMELLVGAEIARVEGRGGDARERYDAAIDAAEAQEVRHHAAIAHELAGRFYLANGKRKVARVYLAEAQYGYLRWGATAKASALADEHFELLGGGRPPAASSPDLSVTTTTDKEGGDHLDTAAMVRAAQAIAGEIELSALLEKLMRIVVESAGATSGALLLEREGRLFIEATMSVEPEIIRLGMSAPLDEDADLATSIVHFVERTGEVVVIGDVTRAGPFAGDPHLLAHPHRSILGLAMLHQGRLIGALYLENQAASEAFTPARVEVARVLAAQAAIAVDNARMVAELRRRTDALSQANDQLQRELGEREAAEAAREQLKEELNRVQTPIIPITDRVMVMPLIGAIDAERARQVLETALAGAQKSRAAVVILDVTGVEAVDAGVTGTLVSTASALRLLGAQAVITGIRPDIAQALVARNVDLRGVVTLGTLESGIAYAMDRLKSRRL